MSANVAFSYYENCWPDLEYLTKLRATDPEWSLCDKFADASYWYAVYDLPQVLIPAKALAPAPTKDAGLPLSASPASPVVHSLAPITSLPVNPLPSDPPAKYPAHSSPVQSIQRILTTQGLLIPSLMRRLVYFQQIRHRGKTDLNLRLTRMVEILNSLAINSPRSGRVQAIQLQILSTAATWQLTLVLITPVMGIAQPLTMKEPVPSQQIHCKHQLQDLRQQSILQAQRLSQINPLDIQYLVWVS